MTKSRSKQPLLTQEQMQKLNTKRLLAYRTSLIKKYQDGPDWDNPNHPAITKASLSWQETYKDCIDILNTREHVE